MPQSPHSQTATGAQTAAGSQTASSSGSAAAEDSTEAPPPTAARANLSEASETATHPLQRAARRVLARLEAPHVAELPTPAALRLQLPVTPRAQATITTTRKRIQHIIERKDCRHLIVVGPCSVHDPRAVLEYALRLTPLAQELSDVAVVCMRVYFDKPRTTVGWKGFINDPHLDGSGRVAAGLAAARALLLEISAMGLGTASELLDPISACYLQDVLVWAAIGARTSESQTHRELASSLDLPVGLKNPLSGDLESVAQGLVAIQTAHTRLTLGDGGQPEVQVTSGNPASHGILRGGKAGPNFDASSVRALFESQQAQGIDAPVLVDASHGNSGKDPERQSAVVADVMRQLQAPDCPIMGVMLESHLEGGRQDLTPSSDLRYGVSITDACLGWGKTAALLREYAAALRAKTKAVPSPEDVVGERSVQPTHRAASVPNAGANVPTLRFAVPG